MATFTPEGIGTGFFPIRDISIQGGGSCPAPPPISPMHSARRQPLPFSRVRASIQGGASPNCSPSQPPPWVEQHARFEAIHELPQVHREGGAALLPLQSPPCVDQSASLCLFLCVAIHSSLTRATRDGRGLPHPLAPSWTPGRSAPLWGWRGSPPRSPQGWKESCPPRRRSAGPGGKSASSLK